jgi:hypothetical protein
MKTATPKRHMNEVGAAGPVANRRKAIDAYADVYPAVVKLRGEGYSLGSIVAILNDDGRSTRNGKPFKPNTIRRIIARAAASRQAVDVSEVN